MLEIALLCAGCHGMSGEGRPQAGYPRLAGQLERYIERQLEAFADGRRPSRVMSPLAARLAAEERRRLSVYWSRLVPPAPGPAAAGPAPAERGARLALVGDNRRRVQACQNCHGPDGAGRAPYGASLAGLHAAYLKSELLAWKTGRRDTDPSGAMRVIARNLSEPDIDAVSAYYAALRPRVPQDADHRSVAR